jgi:hypothetical protein
MAGCDVLTGAQVSRMRNGSRSRKVSRMRNDSRSRKVSRMRNGSRSRKNRISMACVRVVIVAYVAGTSGVCRRRRRSSACVAE